ncbi:MAG: alcohol dehydrogenase [Sphingomonas bacterium]|uniref:PQQ-dependent dehydrogenase, methanol/ethanol family n=1 Tax=Sphingomonas bacterium TaxID=1895847 RepID=UPI00261A9525|nr:PQQ-dependent dehydrogenase, methanol/ethanol family [Sphingomonas bacterium]MDB5705137.1 alcohol dehydrogenase [Sphingomonas bacterium]
MRLLPVLLGALLLTGCIRFASNNDNTSTSAPAGATGVAKIDAAYLTSGGNGSDWAATGYNYNEQRFSPLDRINATNVGTLGLAWFADLPDARGQEATPIVIDGTIYVTGPWSKLFAYDALSGRELWEFDPKIDKAKGVQACCDVVNRGVAAWKGRLYLGTLDGRLIAIDATSGKQVWSVQTTDNAKPYTITGAPRVVKDMVIIGNGGAEFGVRGYVTAYDAGSGAKKWRFYTVPNAKGAADGEVSDAILAKAAAGTWSADGQWKQSGGGGTVWDAIVYDAELDQLYLGVGNGNPWNHGLRSEGKGDNLFLSSVVALKPETGRYLWHYQETPAESWDFTATQPIILATLKMGGADRKVLMQAPKNGFFFVIDRTNGKPIAANKFVSTVNWADRYGADWRPVETATARYYRTMQPFIGLPSALAAHNWQPMSFNPKAGLVYIPAQDVGMAYIPPLSAQDAARQPVGFNTGTNLSENMMPRDPAMIAGATKATVGALVAFDPVTGKERWRVDYPVPWNGGTMTTAGNLVFQGTALGEFRAYAADSGKQLLAFPVQSGIMAGASTFLVKGEQYVAVTTGRGGSFPLAAGYAGGAARTIPNLPRLLVFKLGGTAKLPALPAVAPPADTPPAATGTPEQIAAGKALFGRNCQVCHGANAGGGGVLPDLQHSGVLADAATWNKVVIDGILKGNGMVSFARVMTPEQAQSVRLYIIDEANWARANLDRGATSPTLTTAEATLDTAAK